MKTVFFSRNTQSTNLYVESGTVFILKKNINETRGELSGFPYGTGWGEGGNTVNCE